MDKVMAILFTLIIAGVLFLMFTHIEDVEEQKSWCEDAGGVPLLGDKSYFKLCLNPDAIIEKPEGVE